MATLPIDAADPVYRRRRDFLGATLALGFGLGAGVVATATSADPALAAEPGNTSLGPLKHVDAGVLNIGYAEAGPADGSPVILLHGWPYDIHMYVDVAPRLAQMGYRVIVPYLRGYGTTRFLLDATPRNGQQSVVAADVVALMDALGIEKAIVSAAATGAPAPPTSSLHCGRSGRRPWFPSAAI